MDEEVRNWFLKGKEIIDNEKQNKCIRDALCYSFYELKKSDIDKAIGKRKSLKDIYKNLTEVYYPPGQIRTKKWRKTSNSRVIALPQFLA